jgi:hypothetical protein
VPRSRAFSTEGQAREGIMLDSRRTTHGDAEGKCFGKRGSVIRKERLARPQIRYRRTLGHPMLKVARRRRHVNFLPPRKVFAARRGGRE